MVSKDEDDDGLVSKVTRSDSSRVKGWVGVGGGQIN